VSWGEGPLAVKASAEAGGEKKKKGNDSGKSTPQEEGIHRQKKGKTSGVGTEGSSSLRNPLKKMLQSFIKALSWKGEPLLKRRTKKSHPERKRNLPISEEGSRKAT